MPVFSRRRLQRMLDEMAATLGAEKGRDILRRLDNTKDVDQALPAEMELALLWGLSTLGPLLVEPELDAGTGRPDAWTEALLPGSGCAVEIATHSDNSLSGEEAMDRVAQQISRCADQAKKGAGKYLYYSFGMQSETVKGHYHRWRLVPDNYRLPQWTDDAVRQWIANDDWDVRPLRIVDSSLDVTIERKTYKQTRYHNIWSAMPTETRSIDDNPLFGLLKRKARQMRGVPKSQARRIIFLADGGSVLLNQLKAERLYSPVQQPFTATQIISHFLLNGKSGVDAVVTFTPQTDYVDTCGNTIKRWVIKFFGTQGFEDIPEGLRMLANALPNPHYEGYQARSLYRQGVFNPKSRGEYLGMSMSGFKGETEVKFPARKLLDLLAGRLSPQMFEAMMTRSGKDHNIFAFWLDKGWTVSGAEMVARDLDEDDDHIILKLTDDPGARPFELGSVVAADQGASGAAKEV